MAILGTVGWLSTGCGASDAEIRRAKASGYMTDFAIVFRNALAVIKARYPKSDDDARAGKIITAWHPVNLQGGGRGATLARGNNLNNAQTSLAGAAGVGQNTTNIGNTADPLGRQYFVRFTVRVTGGRPWRVHVRGEVSLWRVGEQPQQLRGADIPPWLRGREESLQLEIYRRLERYAVEIPPRRPESADAKKAAALELGRFANLPSDAADVLARVYRLGQVRDVGELRQHMVEDFVWSRSEPPSSVVAVAMWQADATVLQDLVRTLEGGCRLSDDSFQIGCPGVQSPPISGARFAKRSGRWRFTYFVR